MPKIDIAKAVVRTKGVYPQPHRSVTDGREKAALGNVAGLTQFGVNLTRLKPGAASALRHWHEQEDEFIYVLEGELALIEDDGETLLKPGDCAGFKAGVSNGHQLVNKSQRDARLSRNRHAGGDRARALSRCRSRLGTGRARHALSAPVRRAVSAGALSHEHRPLQARHRRRRHRARHLGLARPLDERHRPQGHGGARRHRRDRSRATPRSRAPSSPRARTRSAPAPISPCSKC